MKKTVFTDLFNADFNIDNIIAVARPWTSITQFSFLENPRRSLGLLLLTDCPASIVFPDKQQLVAKPGDLILLPKGARYAIHFLLEPDQISHPFLINFRLTWPNGQEIALADQVHRLCRDDDTLRPLFAAAMQQYKAASPASLKAKVYELLDSALIRTQEDECCIRYINQNYTKQLNVCQLAKRCGLSETAYRKHFKQIAGISPVQYISRLKIEKACQLLQSADISTKEISDFLNFYSLPYFYRVFKAHTGYTPNQFRDLHSHSQT